MEGVLFTTTLNLLSGLLLWKKNYSVSTLETHHLWKNDHYESTLATLSYEGF